MPINNCTFSLVFIPEQILSLLRKLYIFCELHNTLIQFIVIIIMIITIWVMKKQIDVMKKQIDEMLKIENEKRLIAIQALIEELKYNKEVIKWYIQHSEEGANINLEKKGFSWEWNPPHFGAYEQYLGLACSKNIGLALKITSLYAKLESCKTIVYYIHQLLANNLIEVKVITGGDQLLEQHVKNFNKQIYDISREIKDSFDELILGLETLMQN